MGCYLVHNNEPHEMKTENLRPAPESRAHIVCSVAQITECCHVGPVIWALSLGCRHKA